MIAQTFDEVFSPPWINTHLSHPTHDLIILRQLIPWQSIIDGLVPFYNLNQGRTGCALRTLVAVSILARLRQLSDRLVIAHIQENRYMQYFCNVPDPNLRTVMHPSTLCRYRKHVGQEGISLIEDEVFTCLKRADVIEASMMLMDATVLDSPIIYPTDIPPMSGCSTKPLTKWPYSPPRAISSRGGTPLTSKHAGALTTSTLAITASIWKNSIPSCSRL